MSEQLRPALRVLVADDEASVRDAYRQIFLDADTGADAVALRDLRERLFAKSPSAAPRRPRATFAPVFCEGAETAVAAVREAVEAEQPFAVVFLDMRMPPGPDGAWAAARIRDVDPAIEIVLCTAYSDVDPEDIGRTVVPEEKLSFLQKPFHPHEVRQMTISLASKWRAEHRIVKLAYFDGLTGLPNREQSRSRLAAEVAAAAAQQEGFSVFYLDLDNFKRVNDTLGHAAGDELLSVIATRLRRSVQNDGASAGSALVSDASASALAGRALAGRADLTARPNHVGRLGGDEFIVILPGMKSTEEAAGAAARMLEALQAPISLDQHTVVVTPSIGIAQFPLDGKDVESLLRSADLAMYFAKRSGPGKHAFFDAAMNVVALQRFTLEDRMRGALQRGEFSLQYQPQFDVSTGMLAGMEALLRWNHPELGSVAPDVFMPVAEETGLILPIGEWVLRTACTQATAWMGEGLPAVRMAVNVSAQQFTLKGFPVTVQAILAETGIPAHQLELEITESVVMKDEAWAEMALRELKGLGVQIAIDDFGIGYSSFGRLRHFAVDRLKIDRSFIATLIERSDDRAIAAAIIAMSRSLRISVTAEGVESYPQLSFLQEHACHEAQGFLFSRALSPQEAHELLCRVAASAGSRTQRLKTLIG